MATLEAKTELFWNAVQAKTLDMLKSTPTNPHKDALLDKFKQGDCSLAECQELEGILETELVSKRLNNGKRLAYFLILGRLRMTVYELRTY